MSIKKEKLTKDQVCGLCREYSPRGYVIKDVGVGPRICTTYVCARETFDEPLNPNCFKPTQQPQR